MEKETNNFLLKRKSQNRSLDSEISLGKRVAKSLSKFTAKNKCFSYFETLLDIVGLCFTKNHNHCFRLPFFVLNLLSLFAASVVHDSRKLLTHRNQTIAAHLLNNKDYPHFAVRSKRA